MSFWIHPFALLMAPGGLHASNMSHLPFLLISSCWSERYFETSELIQRVSPVISNLDTHFGVCVFWGVMSYHTAHQLAPSLLSLKNPINLGLNSNPDMANMFRKGLFLDMNKELRWGGGRNHIPLVVPASSHPCCCHFLLLFPKPAAPASSSVLLPSCQHHPLAFFIQDIASAILLLPNKH